MQGECSHGRINHLPFPQSEKIKRAGIWRENELVRQEITHQDHADFNMDIESNPETCDIICCLCFSFTGCGFAYQ